MAENEQAPRPAAAGQVEQAVADANAGNQDGQAEGQAAPDQQVEAQHGEVRAANAPANEVSYISSVWTIFRETLSHLIQ